MKIARLSARPILDSRGNPTVQVSLELENGIKVSASVPSGASKGTYEAVELRDGGKEFNGLGVMTACKNVGHIFEAIKDIDVEKQREIDLAMIALDGTPNKATLGANAMLGVSFACLKAGALSLGKEYFQQVNALFNEYFQKNIRMSYPAPLFNILNGGQHADNGMDFQEFIITPFVYNHIETVFDHTDTTVTYTADQVREFIRKGSEILHSLNKVLKAEGYMIGIGDEGGDEPPLKDTKAALNMICEATLKAGYKLYDEICVGMDCASDYFYDRESGKYIINGKRNPSLGQPMDRGQMYAYYEFFLKNYPVVYMEDFFAEEDWDAFAGMTNNPNLPHIAYSGDDLVVTNKDRLKMAIEKKAISAMIVKPNQIGTIYETFEVVNMCLDNHILYVPSHRSGETNDSLITDIAVGLGARFLKAGAPQRGERVAKYNRLLEITDILG